MAKDFPTNFTLLLGSDSFTIEKELLKDMPEDLLLANKNVIKYSMENIFNQSRNLNVDPYIRDVVASFIFEKMARYGLVTAIHTFNTTKPNYEGMKDKVSISDTQYADMILKKIAKHIIKTYGGSKYRHQRFEIGFV